MHLIDTHCHLDVADFDADRDRVLAQCRVQGVGDIVVPAIERAGWPKLLALCAEHGELHPALGLHPVFMDRHGDADLPALEAALAEQPPLAVGEIGLDFALEQDAGARERQRELCAAQLAIAANAGLPVLLHVRKAHDTMLGLLRRAGVQGGIAHAFNGSLEQARAYLDLGFKLGFGGMLTFERSAKLRRLAAALPLDALVLETDAPDLTVASHRYQRNSPEYLPEVLTALAEVRQSEPAEVAAATTANARAVLALPAPAAA
ncbi:DNAase [Thiohalocapsa halophila]|uniref:DNAase n=1 Tax=Thiohalocapsa halophila TaxID=69359 RepID=A0ABS1CD31_9GAMM|nr:TatD family hydrolase [Thiohalocapsa halophila]MBK1629785.1 DNAase [Thiohalocapsa halophila]